MKAPPAPAWLRMLRRSDMRCAGRQAGPQDLRLWALLACITFLHLRSRYSGVNSTAPQELHNVHRKQKKRRS